MPPPPTITSDALYPAQRLLVWLIASSASVPRWHGTTLRFFDARTLDQCLHCGRGKEVLAHQIGSRSCQRCIRIVMRRHLRAKHGGSSAVHES